MLVNVLSFLLSTSIGIEYTWMHICIKMGLSERQCFSVVLFQCFRHGANSMSFFTNVQVFEWRVMGGGACESTSLSIYHSSSSLILFSCHPTIDSPACCRSDNARVLLSNKFCCQRCTQCFDLFLSCQFYLLFPRSIDMQHHHWLVHTRATWGSTWLTMCRGIRVSFFDLNRGNHIFRSHGHILRIQTSWQKSVKVWPSFFCHTFPSLSFLFLRSFVR